MKIENLNEVVKIHAVIKEIDDMTNSFHTEMKRAKKHNINLWCPGLFIRKLFNFFGISSKYYENDRNHDYESLSLNPYFVEMENRIISDIKCYKKDLEKKLKKL